VKVLDFGLARMLRPATETSTTESLTAEPRLAGTLPYMAPEQLEGKPADARTDLWAYLEASANLTGATITGTNLDGATLCGTSRTDGTIYDTSCPASTDTDETDTDETETTTEASEAEVTSFELSELDCGSATTGPVTVTWETENATAVEIAVDTASPSGQGPSGSTTVVVACDGEPHAITITPQSDAGPGVPKTEEVSSDQ